jgi:PIN like domain
MAQKDDPPDIFLLEKLFPQANQLFSLKVPPLESVHEACDVVLDTNVLLFPYRTELKSLIEIRSVYQKLIKEGRLFIPARVVREFFRNKASKLLEVTKALSDKYSAVVAPSSISYPLLDDFAEYKTVLKTKKELDESFKAYRAAFGKLLEATSSLEWNDPVSEMYREIFLPEIINELATKSEDIEEALRFRIRNKIPPGYKDASKDDQGVGDLVIWMTILQIGKTRKQSLLFVTGEEKADWYHRSNKRGALPRYELIEEFRRESGCDFYMSSLSEFLKLFNAPEGIVSTIREQEATDNFSTVVRSSVKINVRLIEGLELLRQMAHREPRTAIRRSWELLATTIFGATNVLYETLNPDSEAMSMAVKRLEGSPEFSTALVSLIKRLRNIARLVINQSEWAYAPSPQDAEQYVLDCVGARGELGEN